MSSHLKNFELRLIPTQKLISQIKKRSPQTFLVGFKLETDTNKNNLLKKAKQLIKEAKCDLIVANTMNKNMYQGYIVDHKGVILAKSHSRKRMAQALVKTLKERL
jgi:phosphopantothenoylcysteine synthetase/decarboxylase